MDLLDLFKGNKEFERRPLRPNKYQAQSNCSISSLVSSQSRLSRPIPEEVSKDYYVKYVEEENKIALEAAKSTSRKDGGKIDELSIGTVPTHHPELDNKKTEEFYSNFNFEHRHQENLPIVQSKDEIISTIETHTITVIEGVTGCGKSTQVPQFILDNCYKERKYCNIVVTQPRRIAALSIADRVCKERGWRLGSLIGCQVGMYRKVSKETRLTYCTTGVLLRKFIQAKNMLEYTHVIIDEVHERDQEMDFLLLVIRKLSRSNSRQVRVVLMSATFNVDKFSKYFEVPTESRFVPAPVISIPKKRNFKVHPHYLCQLEMLGALPQISPSEPKVTERMMEFCQKLLNIFDEIDSKSEYDADDLIQYCGEKPRHAVLVFLPGIYEIEEMYRILTSSEQSSSWDIVILHSSITSEEQSKIFSLPGEGQRRVILSTNIAESSITINDIKYVIDFCLTKQLVTDPSTNFQCLELCWASKANCEQRAGRAGRVMDGRVYRLLPKIFYEQLPAEGDPEIVRAPLESLVLQTKVLDMGEPKAVLALAIDPPDLTNLQRTVLLLKEAGGLLDKPNTYSPFNGELTHLGRIMSALPIDIHISKLIALGHVFNVLRETIIMGASMSVKNMFSNPFNNRMEAYSAKVHWADGSTSDCLAFLNAYGVWQKQIAQNQIKKKGQSERLWAKRNFIQIKVMHEVDYLITELTDRLEQLGIKETLGPDKVVMNDIDKAFILKVIIAGAFFPNYFTKANVPEEALDKTNGVKALGGLDPTRTVFLQGWKPEHPGKLYAKRIQELFSDNVPNHNQALVEFDGSYRVYVMFTDDKLYGHEKQKWTGVPGKISQSVYKALKMRKFKSEIDFPILDLKTAKQMAEELKISTSSSSMFFSSDNYKYMKKCLPTSVPLLPPLDISIISIKVTYFENPNKFWVHMADPDTLAQLEKIERFLNDRMNITLLRYESSNPPSIGSLVAADYNNQGIMFRAVVESYFKVKNDVFTNLYFIDTGARSSCRVQDLKKIKNDHEVYNMRALAFQCTLTGIEPCKKRDAKGEWSEEAKDLFTKYVEYAQVVFGTVYSVVDSIVSLRLTCTNCGEEQKSYNINNLLIDNGLAGVVEESYLSKYNNRLREQLVEYDVEHREYLEFLQYSKNYLINTYPEPPAVNDCRSNMWLKGPFSPLEITLSSLALMASTKRVSIEHSSVNSVLLETDPNNPSNRLLVSSLVSQNPSGSHLTLRNTTLMPNIAGLASLICLIFAPKIELRRNVARTYFIGALCGLGYNPKSGEALLPEHDMEVYFDTAIHQDDVLLINRLRHWMDMGICVKTDDVEDDLDEQIMVCQKKVFEILNIIMTRPAKMQKPEKICNFDKWCLYDKSLLLIPSKMKEDSIFPFHSSLNLEDRDEELEELTIHCEELRSLAVSDFRISENIDVYCQLCKEEMNTRAELRIHLFMKQHREREKQLGIKIT